VSPPKDPRNLEQLLDRIQDSLGQQERVSLGGLLSAVGRRSFAPMLLLAGLIALSPLSGIPGMPTTIGIIVILIAGQLVLKRDHFWLPQWVLKRQFARSKMDKALRFLRPPARWVDKILRERLTFLAEGPATYGIAIICLIIAATMPPLEILPFVASAAGAALTAFGLALIARDGVMAVVAFVFVMLTGGLMVKQLMA
jgi:hypothetical protein